MTTELDGCDLDFTEDELTEEEQELYPLFAEAFDPESPETVESLEAAWQELLA